MTAPTLEAGLGDAVRDLLARHVDEAPVRLVVIAMSRDDNPKASILAFPAGSPTPTLALKVALTEGAAESVRAEARALRQLEHVDDTMVDGTVPRVIDLHEEVGLTVLVTTARPGQPMSVGYHQWRHTANAAVVHEDFAAADQWLSRIAPMRLAPSRVPDLAARVRERWPGDALADRVAELAQDCSTRLRPATGGLVHGDFWVGNILRTGQRVTGVVDWEHADPGGDPVRDRVRFALSYSLYLDRHTPAGLPVHGHPGLVSGRPGDPVRHLLAWDGWYADEVSTFVGRGLTESGRTRSLWRTALLLGLIEIATVSDQAEFARMHLEIAAEQEP